MGLGREDFLVLLTAEFSEVVAQIDRSESGLLHCEVGAFRRATERAMDAGQLWAAERHFRFVERLLRNAGPKLRNALEVSYLEDLALGECTPARYQAVKERMPRSLRAVLVRHHENWK